MTRPNEPESIQHEVQEALRRDRRVSAEPLDVSFQSDRLVLQGVVKSHRRKLAALRIAEATAPRLAIDDRIRVGRPGPIDNDVNARAVWSRLLAHEGISHETIDVKARNGRIKLTGVVATPEERLEAENVALAAPGVGRVKNLLVADPAGQQRDAHRSRQLGRLLHSTLGPASESIHVTVSGPRVVLRGEVPGGWYRERAAEVVRLDGAPRLRNRLEVRDEV